MPLRLNRSDSFVSITPPAVAKETTPPDDDDEKLPSNERKEYTNPKHCHQVLKCFNKLRNRVLFTDVILAAGEREFPCHRAVLVAGKCNKLNFFLIYFLE